jgi:hypothetical protein
MKRVVLITAAEVQKHDVVRWRMYSAFIVRGVTKGKDKITQRDVVYLANDPLEDPLAYGPDEEFTLLHRPSEVSKHQLLATLDAAAERVRQALRTDSGQSIYDHLEDPDRAIEKLQEALDAYRLSKPPAPPAPTRNESLVDRHMIP